ncbi:SusD/RagB family nutrient-binding outer membrane lipoprotein [Pedobacter sp. JY14-1]|uniref:SusD/RagB family nutrient-binding outer membrane lipoprotein n=1 Tax=Pedobacter sp. JY14-1 TaxID=3034151 RepID=UPI0023E2E800|nr:SusD/RagB family nutrient-binding outer membrane lipoprotein [Pedobacter sp. JY14-1]
MKNIFKKSCVLLAATVALASCKKFDELTVDPLKANEDQVQVEYFLNNSIISAQMNPDVAERSFVLYWKPAGHQAADYDGGVISVGSYNDGWIGAYYDQVSGWLNMANTAIQIGEKQIAAGTAKTYTPNLIQVARIWRAYLMSEMSDNFGPIPVKGFEGINPDFSDVKTVYYYILDELKDASSKLDISMLPDENLKKLDPAYQYNYAKWRKYANSLRLRLSMRLSEVDAGKAKTEFEAAAATNDFITDNTDNFQVQEKDGWDALTGVMSRSWDTQPLSSTLNNLFTGLGGIKSADLRPDLAAYVKPANWLGQRYPDQFSTKTNDPSAGYWFNGLPYAIDPRAYLLFSIPGDVTNANYPKQNGNYDIVTVRNLKNADGSVAKAIDAKYTWNTRTDGNWGVKDALNEPLNYGGTMPRINMQFRNSTQKRLFFGAWETYFLLAEAAVRNWNSPVSAQTAYETGITKSFEYWGLSLGSYLTSTDYNKVGTSVSWTHTTEPGPRLMNYEDGMTGTAGSLTVNYPKNDLYKNGTVRNDQLTKIITQKFIAQTPWLPLETWNDHRRLGLPFFENPVVEQSINTLPGLTESTVNTASVKFLPQRLKYPSSLQNTNSKGYAQAVSALNGADAILTPLWWAQK